MGNSLISVVMPAYNAEEFIEESIKSVIAQSYNNWELLIVDDGSTDNTKEIIETCCNTDSRIKYYYQQNGKQGKARNLALKHASGEYIAFLDADDVWLPEKLDVQLMQLKEKNVDLVFSDAYMFKESVSDHVSILNSGKGMFVGDAGIHSFLELNKIPTLTVLAKAAVIKKVNGFTESPKIAQAEDYHLWLKLLMNKYIFFGSELVLAGHRKHSFATTTGDALAVPYVIEAFEDLKKQYKTYNNLINKYQKQWFKRFHYITNAWNKNSYKNLIGKNCNYLNKPAYKIFFRSVYSFFGLNFTRKLINKIINNSFAF